MLFINPEKILKQLDFNEELKCADFGCGSGAFTIPLARLVKRGRVFAVDLQKEPLSVLQSQARAENLSNIKPVIADLEKVGSTGISNGSLDYVFLVNVLFQLQDKISCLKEAYRVLGPEESLVIIDWVQKIGLGNEIVSIEDAKLLAIQAGFRFIRHLEAGQYHFAMLFQKN